MRTGNGLQAFGGRIAKFGGRIAKPKGRIATLAGDAAIVQRPRMEPSPIRFVEVAADRAGRSDFIVPGPVVDLRFRHGQKALSLRAGKLLHVLVRAAGQRLGDPVEHSATLAEARIGNQLTENLIDALRELQSTVVEVAITRPGKAGGVRQVMKSGPLLSDAERDLEEAAGSLTYQFSPTMRWVMANATSWAVLSRRVVLGFAGRFSLRMFEIVALRIGLSRKASETFELGDLRRRLGVVEGTLPRWQDIKRRALQPAVDEINHISDIEVTFAPVTQRGRAVVGVKVTWRQKDAAGRREAARELDRHRVGRRARRDGSVEQVVGIVAPDAPKPASARPRPVPAPFPTGGTIEYSLWAGIVRQHAPPPVPDPDVVAGAFRRWAGSKGLKLDGRGVERAFVAFCKQFRTG